MKEENFLNELESGQISVTVFLLNGTKLQGILVAHTQHALFLRRDAHTQLVYKHAISTIMPSQPIDVSYNSDKI
ncbi:MAG: RNA chaperone Hfq [Alphaproteobacteria bacterium]|nr:RNA chaperone Hfq [Alphaproteobacteria bacterium]